MRQDLPAARHSPTTGMLLMATALMSCFAPIPMRARMPTAPNMMIIRLIGSALEFGRISGELIAVSQSFGWKSSGYMDQRLLRLKGADRSRLDLGFSVP